MPMKSLSHWNYRVIAHADVDGSPYVAIHEVHYDDKGVPAAYTECATDVLAEDVDGLRWQLNHMLKACEAPVLSESDFIGNKDDV
mgnify:CR=1 FL=1